MSIVSVNEARMERSGKDSSSSPPTWERAFLVVTNDIEDGPALILDDSAIPQLGDEHPDADYMVVGERDCSVYEDDFHWLVKITYVRESGEQAGDPTQNNPRISFSTVAKEYVADKAYNNDDSPPPSSPDTRGNPTKAVENSAKDPFDPPLMDERRNIVITIQRNESIAEFDPEHLPEYENTLNSSSITIAGVTIAKHEGMMRSIRADKAWDTYGRAYYSVTYDIEVDRETHVRKILDRGYYELVTGKKIPILDSQGNIVQEPFKLNGGGTKALLPIEVTWLSFRTKWALDWSSLDLPTAE